jgi:predicted transcriptional regulator
MKHLSLSKRIEIYLKTRNCWISGDALEKLAQEAHFKASTASRRARELHEAGILDRRETKEGWVEYKYKPQQKEVRKVEIVGDKAILRKEIVYI